MKIDKLKISFFIMIVAVLATSLLLDELSASAGMAIICLFSTPFIVLGIVELNNSDKMSRNQKVMWTFGFVALTLITGILYFISERKKVISQ